MKQDRFLAGILVGVGILVVIALALFFTRQDKRDYIEGDNPESVVYNYVLAIVNADYEKAYGNLADLDNKPTYEQFRQSFFNGAVYPSDTGVDVGEADINGDEAVVGLTLVYSPSDPFSSGYQNTDRALLVLQDDGWKISAMPYTFWDYNWYLEPVKP